MAKQQRRPPPSPEPAPSDLTREQLAQAETTRLSAQVARLASDYSVHIPGIERVNRQREAESAVMIFRFDKVDQAIEVLKAHNFVIIPAERLCAR